MYTLTFKKYLFTFSAFVSLIVASETQAYKNKFTQDESIGEKDKVGKNSPLSSRKATEETLPKSEADTYYEKGMALLKSVPFPRSEANKVSYDEAMYFFKQAARLDHAEANYFLGKESHHHQDDYDTAAIYYQRAAELGHAGAQELLGSTFIFPLPIYERLGWFQRALDQGNETALYKKGESYWSGKHWLGRGHDHEQSFEKALECFRAAAKKKHKLSLYKLGEAHSLGLGVPQSDKAATEFYLIAAELGLPQAQLKIGGAFLRGQGVPKCLDRAAKWFLEIPSYSLLAIEEDESLTKEYSEWFEAFFDSTRTNSFHIPDENDHSHYDLCLKIKTGIKDMLYRYRSLQKKDDPEFAIPQITEGFQLIIDVLDEARLHTKSLTGISKGGLLMYNFTTFAQTSQPSHSSAVFNSPDTCPYVYVSGEFITVGHKVPEAHKIITYIEKMEGEFAKADEFLRVREISNQEQLNRKLSKLVVLRTQAKKNKKNYSHLKKSKPEVLKNDLVSDYKSLAKTSKKLFKRERKVYKEWNKILSRENERIREDRASLATIREAIKFLIPSGAFRRTAEFFKSKGWI